MTLSLISIFENNPDFESADSQKEGDAASALSRDQVVISFQVLKTASEANVTNYPECTRAFAKLVHCPSCQGLGNLAPCNRYCINVVRGCLAPLSDLNSPWKLQVRRWWSENSKKRFSRKTFRRFFFSPFLGVNSTISLLFRLKRPSACSRELKRRIIT